MTSPKVVGGTGAAPEAGLALERREAASSAAKPSVVAAPALTPPPAPPSPPHSLSVSPPSQRPPASAGAEAAVVGVVPPARGAADRSDDGPAQDVRIAAAAMRLRAILFVMPVGTVAAPFRFPDISQQRTGRA